MPEGGERDSTAASANSLDPGVSRTSVRYFKNVAGLKQKGEGGDRMHMSTVEETGEDGKEGKKSNQPEMSRLVSYQLAGRLNAATNISLPGKKAVTYHQTLSALKEQDVDIPLDARSTVAVEVHAPRGSSTASWWQGTDDVAAIARKQ